jgi:hypothetical protein
MSLISSGRHSDGPVDDDLFAELRRDDLVRVSQRRKDVPVNVATKRGKENRLAGQ